MGVHGSTVVDQEARDALDEPVSNCSVPCTYFDPFMAKCILGCLQDSWDQQIHNGLYEVHSLVGWTPCSCGQSWKEQVVLTRCRVGHSRLAHGYLLNNGSNRRVFRVVPVVHLNMFYLTAWMLLTFVRLSTVSTVYMICLHSFEVSGKN